MERHHKIQYFESHNNKQAECTLSCQRYVFSQGANVAEPQMNPMRAVARLSRWPDTETQQESETQEEELRFSCAWTVKA